MAIFIKISRWIIAILLFAIGLPFCTKIFGIPIVLLAVIVAPIKKVDEFRARLFSKKGKPEPAGSVRNKATFDRTGGFVNIGLWDIPSGEYLNTAARYERGLQIEPERVGKIDRAHCSVRIMGSEGYAYNVSLAGCECIDYQRRGLPCKHMLRLAHDLGEEITLPVYDPDSNKDYDPDKDIALLTERWEAGQITTDAYRKCLKALQTSDRH